MSHSWSNWSKYQTWYRYTSATLGYGCIIGWQAVCGTARKATAISANSNGDWTCWKSSWNLGGLHSWVHCLFTLECDLSDQNVIEVLDNAFPHLEELNLSHNEDISNIIIPYLCEKRSDLLKLWLYRISALSYDRLLSKMTRLITFGCSRLHDHWFSVELAETAC